MISGRKYYVSVYRSGRTLLQDAVAELMEQIAF